RLACGFGGLGVWWPLLLRLPLGERKKIPMASVAFDIAIYIATSLRKFNKNPIDNRTLTPYNVCMLTISKLTKSELRHYDKKVNPL
ncbi:MAG: hypothetical protein LBU32_31125, partial [Clostridiales bacterium]|nr:hypothetical protein [Clostridiales bacterium]